MSFIKMGGIEGRAYQSKDPRQGSNLRYYQKYIKPELDKQAPRNAANLLGQGVDKVINYAIGEGTGLGSSTVETIRSYLPKEASAQYLFDRAFWDKQDIENFHMRNNAPGDLTGKPVWSKTRY
jgi:beta-lactamase class A